MTSPVYADIGRNGLKTKRIYFDQKLPHLFRSRHWHTTNTSLSLSLSIYIYIYFNMAFINVRNFHLKWLAIDENTYCLYIDVLVQERRNSRRTVVLPFLHQSIDIKSDLEPRWGFEAIFSKLDSRQKHHTASASISIMPWKPMRQFRWRSNQV